MEATGPQLTTTYRKKWLYAKMQILGTNQITSAAADWHFKKYDK